MRGNFHYIKIGFALIRQFTRLCARIEDLSRSASDERMNYELRLT
jgi:hypothetical protein